MNKIRKEEVQVTKQPYVKEEVAVKKKPVTEMRSISPAGLDPNRKQMSTIYPSIKGLVHIFSKLQSIM